MTERIPMDAAPKPKEGVVFYDDTLDRQFDSAHEFLMISVYGDDCQVNTFHFKGNRGDERAVVVRSIKSFSREEIKKNTFSRLQLTRFCSQHAD